MRQIWMLIDLLQDLFESGKKQLEKSKTKQAMKLYQQQIEQYSQANAENSDLELFLKNHKGDKQANARLLALILIPVYIRYFNEGELKKFPYQENKPPFRQSKFPPAYKDSYFHQTLSKLGEILEPKFTIGETTIAQALSEFKK